MVGDDDHDRLVRLEERMAGQAAALEVARQVLDERVNRLNEFRGALADAQSTMMPRGEVTLLIEAMERRVRILETQGAGSIGRGAGIQWIVATLLIGAGLIISAIIAFKP